MKKITAFLIGMILLFSAATCWADNFLPGETAPLNATTSSSRVQLTVSSSSTFPDVMVVNTGSVTAFIACGGSTITAQVPGSGTLNSTPVAPGAILILRKGSSLYCAAITSSSTTQLYFTAGVGN